VLLTLGFIAASVGYSSWTAQRTIFDPAATPRRDARAARHTGVQTMLARTSVPRCNPRSARRYSIRSHRRDQPRQ